MRFQLKETKRLECTAPLPKGKTPTLDERPWNVFEENCEDMRDIYNRILEKALEEGCLITSGPGRGKTFLTKWLAAEAEKRGEVVLTAPTHVAAKVLDHEKAITLARYCHKGGNPPTLLVVDECFMVSSILWHALYETWIRKPFRLIAVGDPEQFRAILEDIPDEKLLASPFFKTICGHTL